jgi:hypothetical protein
MAAEYVDPYFQGRIGSQCRYRWHGEIPPDDLPNGYIVEIETTMIPSMADYMDGLQLTTVML